MDVGLKGREAIHFSDRLPAFNASPPSHIIEKCKITPANTMDTILNSLMRILMDGPEVSLKGSPTVSPTTALSLIHILDTVLEEGAFNTPDIGGNATTAEYVEEIIKRL